MLLLVVSLVRARDGSEDGTSCNGPSITKVNFQYYIEILNGTNRTLSCEIRSDTPLKEELIWRKGSSRLPTDIKYSVENSSCSNSSNQTCIVSNLTLINAVRYKDSSPYVGNYTLTAENDCGIATVYVYVDIYGKSNPCTLTKMTCITLKFRHLVKTITVNHLNLRFLHHRLFRL